MRVPFVKMHGLGNDFIVLDARARAIPELTAPIAARLADRHCGIGCDQLVLLGPSDDADFGMRIFNADGGEVEACGNAARAVAVLHGSAARLETAGGVIAISPEAGGASVDMGEPAFAWDAIPIEYPMDTAQMPVAWEKLHNPAAINVGNPHVVFFVNDLDEIPLERLGPVIERDSLFPERINVNVAQIDGDTVRLQVWERGTGLTRACGTGACATAVAAIRRGLARSPVTVALPGGKLTIEWSPGRTITMTGPAAESYRGDFEWSDYA